MQSIVFLIFCFYIYQTIPNCTNYYRIHLITHFIKAQLYAGLKINVWILNFYRFGPKQNDY